MFPPVTEENLFLALSPSTRPEDPLSFRRQGFILVGILSLSCFGFLSLEKYVTHELAEMACVFLKKSLDPTSFSSYYPISLLSL